MYIYIYMYLYIIYIYTATKQKIKSSCRFLMTLSIVHNFCSILFELVNFALFY